MTHQPRLFAYTKRATYEALKTGEPIKRESFANLGKESLANTASHWGSVYKNEVESNCAKGRIRSERPVWSLPREAYSSKRSHYQTEFGHSFGKNGENPRDKLPHSAVRQGNETHELTMGTTKTTEHIPGYNGFIPKSDFNGQALDQSKLAGHSRNTILKQNIVENYQVKVPGY